MIKRWHLTFLFISLITLLCLYSGLFHPWTDLDDCIKNPENHDGDIVTHFKEPRIGTIYPDGFKLIQKDGHSIRVYSDFTGATEGEYIAIKAIFHSQGYLELLDIRILKNRKYKMFVSIFPVLFIGILFFRYFRFNFKKFFLEPKDYA